jgi:hypothetical protein
MDGDQAAEWNEGKLKTRDVVMTMSLVINKSRS